LDSYLLKVNYANLKLAVHENYLGKLKLFDEAISLCLLIAEDNAVLSFGHISLESALVDRHYHRARVQSGMARKLACYPDEEALHLAIDLLPMVEHFLTLHYKPNKQNYFSWSLDRLININIRLNVV
jgi:hypothetical protein